MQFDLKILKCCTNRRRTKHKTQKTNAIKPFRWRSAKHKHGRTRQNDDETATKLETQNQ
jgi:hypothetical protein